MCEIFGFISDRKTQINNELELFFKRSQYHPDGWGIRIDDKPIVKDWVCANKSELNKELLSDVIECNLAIAHIRLATVGKIELKNNHPFEMKDKFNNTWTLVHNGTALNGTELFRYEKLQKGSTDSERVLLYFIHHINDLDSSEGIFKAIEKCIGNISKRNKLNLIFSDGKFIYVHTNLKNSLHYKRSDRGIYFSTEPLEDNGMWNKVPMNRLLVFDSFGPVYQGENHFNEYFTATLPPVDFCI